MNDLTTIKPKAYSYIRFSTPEQERGDSLRRQTEAAVRYAALHRLDLDDKLTFRDLGVSAFTGANEETGRLGEFLEAVHHGDIQRGSYLLVESLDRLSRQKPRRAVKVLERICEAGITVVTLDDGREYTEETLDEDPLALMVALLVASRAHEESAKKGRRVGAAWANKRDKAKADNKPLTALCPGWLRLNADRSGFDVIPERADIVRRIFTQTLDGIGQHGIAQRLNREGVPVFGRGQMWQRSYINKMLADHAVIGNFTPHRAERINGKKVRIPTDIIEGYFPAIIEREAFERVTSMIRARPTSTRAPVANILAGLARCPLCDTTMTRVNKGSGTKQGKPYLVCSRAKVGAGCDYKQVRMENVEHAIVHHVEELLGGLPSPTEGLQAKWEELIVHHDVILEEIERLVEAVARAGHSKALLDRLRKMEHERDEITKRLEGVEGLIADSLTNRVQNTVRELVGKAQDEERDAAKINGTMRQLFSKVVVDYRDGQLWFHWKHAEREQTGIVYGTPQEA
ncbi:recombinase family protein [Rhizobium sp. MC63]|uniref:Recombinase family protein n=1 Tax=Rhizobium mulingense TaxID=3031128 RepID=A0ACC6MUH2_9HYPH|nr:MULTISPECIES: recombinase family protein [unclassified Rhizobium]MDF0695607.1 recombinase family protein [Rhizobium sp. MC63]MEA3517030.1 recombinase family protein [Rhizobium sp. MJ31]